MKAKHTPGPWTVRSTCIYTADEHEDWVASCGNGQVARQQINKANARLIAAAPELLEALQFVMTASGEQLSTAFEQAQAAIAKATGEQT